jgi:plastocyanin
MQRTLLGALLVGGLAGCGQSTLEAAPLEVAITANRTTAAPGDTIAFVVNATGQNLVGLLMDFGDMGTDLYATSGARTARVTFKHAFMAKGAFTVTVSATDAVAGQKDASIEIRVN